MVAVKNILDNPSLAPPHKVASMRKHEDVTKPAAEFLTDG